MKQIVNLASLKETGSLKYGDVIIFTYPYGKEGKVLERKYIVSRDGGSSGSKYFLNHLDSDNNAEIFRHLNLDKSAFITSLFGFDLRDGMFPYCTTEQMYHIVHALFELIETGSYKKPLYFSDRLKTMLQKNITNDVICSLLLNNPDSIS